LNKVVSFHPHYAIFGMDADDLRIYHDLCSDDTGAYCAEDPDGPGPITGREVLKEDVRQLCVHMLYQVHTTPSLRSTGDLKVVYAEKYWQYIEKFLESCPIDAKEPSNRFGDDCSRRLMKQLGLDTDRIEACVRVNTTAYLRNEREHPAWSPRALRINGWRYSGILDADLVTSAICSAFTTQPGECRTLLRARDPFASGLFASGQAPQAAESVSGFSMVSWVAMVGAGICGGLVLYKRYLKKDMRTTLREEVILEVQAQMGDYARMGSRA